MSGSRGPQNVNQRAAPLGFTENPRRARFGNYGSNTSPAVPFLSSLNAPAAPPQLGGPLREPMPPANIYRPPPRNYFQPFGRMNPYQALFMRQLMGPNSRGLL